MIKDNTSHYINQAEIATYLLDVRKHSALTRDQEIELIKKIKTGCRKSKELLVLSNLRFVISVAKQYMHQGLDLSDLISEGNYGLLKAAEKFNYEEANVRFLSYAVWWVKQSIMQALTEYSRTIRIPSNVLQDIQKQKKIMSRNIKLIWDFRGEASAKTAEHHEIHLKEYISIEKLPLNITGFEIKNEMHAIAFMVVTDENMISVRDALKPHRGEVF